jgi:orotate phosphoribosyltransferase
MENLEQTTAKNLLQINAIIFNPANPFLWSSGWKSPIYCDNRKTLSYPEIRNFLKKSFAVSIRNKYPTAEVIAGVATGAIAIGALTADELGLPFVYIRSKSKGHGLENMIEGDLKQDQQVVVIEDLVSTGKSSINAVHALRNAGANVLGMNAIFSYGFDIAEQNFLDADCPLHTLTNYETMIEIAVKEGYLEEKDIKSLTEWRKDPANWGNN